MSCKAFMERLEESLTAGVEAAAREYANRLFDRLNERRGFVSFGGEYIGSEEGEAPAVFERWFTDNLKFEVEHLEAHVGFDHAHAAQVYRMLVQGTKHIDKREGPVELYNQIKELVRDAFVRGFESGGVPF